MASENFKVYRNNRETMKYANSNIVYGSVAYDLNTLPKRQQEEETWVKEQVKTRTYKSAKPQKQGVSLFAISGFAAFVVMMVFVLLASIQLTQITHETAHLESRIMELSEQEARLRIEYESAFNLTEIEEYATKKLGMVRQTSDNIIFLETTNVDRAVILEQKTADDDGFFTGFKDFLSSLLEYF